MASHARQPNDFQGTCPLPQGNAEKVTRLSLSVYGPGGPVWISSLSLQEASKQQEKKPWDTTNRP
jgi:hypothetical protein